MDFNGLSLCSHSSRCCCLHAAFSCAHVPGPGKFWGAIKTLLDELPILTPASSPLLSLMWYSWFCWWPDTDGICTAVFPLSHSYMNSSSSFIQSGLTNSLLCSPKTHLTYFRSWQPYTVSVVYSFPPFHRTVFFRLVHINLQQSDFYSIVFLFTVFVFKDMSFFFLFYPSGGRFWAFCSLY